MKSYFGLLAVTACALMVSAQGQGQGQSRYPDTSGGQAAPGRSYPGLNLPSSSGGLDLSALTRGQSSGGGMGGGYGGMMARLGGGGGGSSSGGLNGGLMSLFGGGRGGGRGMMGAAMLGGGMDLMADITPCMILPQQFRSMCIMNAIMN